MVAGWCLIVDAPLTLAPCASAAQAPVSDGRARGSHGSCGGDAAAAGAGLVLVSIVVVGDELKSAAIWDAMRCCLSASDSTMGLM